MALRLLALIGSSRLICIKMHFRLLPSSDSQVCSYLIKFLTTMVFIPMCLAAVLPK